MLPSALANQGNRGDEIRTYDRRCAADGTSQLLEALLRRKGRDDSFKAWISPQGIPPAHQFQLTIGEGAGVANIAVKLLTGRSVVANPSRDHRKIGDHDAPVDRIFFYWKKLDCSPAFRRASSVSAPELRRSNRAGLTADRSLVELGRFSPAPRVQQQKPTALFCHL